MKIQLNLQQSELALILAAMENLKDKFREQASNRYSNGELSKGEFWTELDSFLHLQSKIELSLGPGITQHLKEATKAKGGRPRDRFVGGTDLN